MWSDEYARMLKEERERLGYKRHELAHYFGVSGAGYGKWERLGSRNPGPLEQLKAFARGEHDLPPKEDANPVDIALEIRALRKDNASLREQVDRLERMLQRARCNIEYLEERAFPQANRSHDALDDNVAAMHRRVRDRVMYGDLPNGDDE